MSKRKKKTTVTSQKKKWGSKTYDYEKVTRSIHLDDELMKNIKDELPKMKYITQTQLAEKYDIRASTAKTILADLQTKKLIEEVAHTPRITVFKPVSDK